MSRRPAELGKGSRFDRSGLPPQSTAKCFGKGDGFEHGFGFVHGFLVFAFRSGIVNPATTRLNVCFSVFQKGSANRDAAIEISVKGKITNAAAIRPARGLFQFRNDLHGADFWRATESAGRESGAHQIMDGFVLRQYTFNLGNDVHDMAVTLNDHQVFDMDRSEVAYPPEVVSGEINEHNVLGALLRIGEQFIL